MPKSVAFEEGYDAYLIGDTLDDNPYGWYDEHGESEDWEDGWYTAKDDEEEDY